MRRFARVELDGVPHVGRVDGRNLAVFDHDDPLRALSSEEEPIASVALDGATLLPPIEAPEIWCAGVTYERSREARLAESKTDARDAYARVYEAARPELFMKDAQMRRTVGHEGTIHVRSDSSWTVPEPELGVVLDGNGRPAAMTIGNDVSSRDIEGENPLYIPQAKVFAGACAIGPVLAVPESWDAPLSIQLRIFGPDGRGLFAGETSTARMKRTVHDLVSWLVRDNPVPPGSVLLTGTGLVPPDDYTLESGHVVEIEIEGIGVLTNVVA